MNRLPRVLGAGPPGSYQHLSGLVEMVTSGAAAIAGLGDHLGSLEAGRPADVQVLEPRHEDPRHNVVEAERSWVGMVCVNGVPSYGRADWVSAAHPACPATGERLLAWGEEMLLDTATVTLAQLRAALITQYRQIGPIFA